MPQNDKPSGIERNGVVSREATGAGVIWQGATVDQRQWLRSESRDQASGHPEGAAGSLSEIHPWADGALLKVHHLQMYRSSYPRMSTLSFMLLHSCKLFVVLMGA